MEKRVNTFWNSNSSPCTRMSLYGESHPTITCQDRAFFKKSKTNVFCSQKLAVHGKHILQIEQTDKAHPTPQPLQPPDGSAGLTPGPALPSKHSRWLKGAWQLCEICTPQPSHSSSTSTCIHSTSVVKWSRAPVHITAVINNCLLEQDKGISFLSSWTSRTASKSRP